MNTPIPFILLAIDGCVEFVKITSPFGYEDKKKKKPDPSPGEVASKIRGLMASAGKG